MVDFVDESFVVAICFIIFVYLAYRPIKKAIVKSLDDRIKEIKDNLNNTEKLREDAKKLLDQVESKISGLEAKEKEILESAEISTKRLVDDRSKEMDLLLERKKESVNKYIKAKKTKAVENISSEFTNSVIKTVREYLLETKNNSVSDKEIFDHFIKK